MVMEWRMKLEEVVVDAIAQALLKRFDKLSRPSVVAVMSMPATAVGHEFKKALRDELKKRRRTAKGRRLKSA
ncbi:hypothetical protein D7S78_18825 [Ralstonia pickettii]|jgi:acyl-CoA synthetase (AMP-forming)/AMP-acid ligase II|nr:hypothetical protein [Ralstonia sp.]MBA9847567.1 hypothetical protein [Ralstonia pickettii]MBA4236690.1 hypothetical protein [Ralstonia sp.]MBA4403306.1 hypothetical protein [Ralstonia sp.]MBA9852968.1 hypothetical protein [Ralstonia pickettii]